MVALTVTVKKLQKMLWIDTGMTSLVAKIVKNIVEQYRPNILTELAFPS